MSKPALTDSAARLYEPLTPAFFPTDEQQDWAGAKFIAALATMKDPAAQIIQPSGTKPPFAILFCPQECPEAWLPWVAQFVGVAPAVISGLLASGQVAAARQWIEHPLNLERGTNRGICIVTEATLTGAKTVLLYPNLNGPFTIKVATYTAQTPRPKETEEAIESMLPAWVALEYVTVVAGTLAELEAAHAKLSEDESAHATLVDMELNPGK